MRQELFFDITMSLDGYIAGPGDSPEQPIGIDGELLHEWVTGLRSWREAHGLEGGVDSEIGRDLRALTESAGATIMGHRMFEMGSPSWGDDPPFHQPVFILTHHPRESVSLRGRHHVPLRHRRPGARAGTGPRGGRGQARPHRRRRAVRAAVPERRAGRPFHGPHRPDPASQRGAPVRGRCDRRDPARGRLLPGGWRLAAHPLPLPAQLRDHRARR